MLCEVGSSFTTCSGWFARTANTCGMYMQPFCSTTIGWVGGSNVRSPNPSETNTITFCRSPFESVITSWANTGEECCFAQLGSVDMLMSLGFGTAPSNRTVPFKSPPPTAPVSGGAPPPFALELETQIARVRANRETSFFSRIQIHLIRDSCWQTSFLWLHAGESFVVSAAIAGRERGAVLICGPATH